MIVRNALIVFISKDQYKQFVGVFNSITEKQGKSTY